MSPVFNSYNVDTLHVSSNCPLALQSRTVVVTTDLTYKNITQTITAVCTENIIILLLCFHQTRDVQQDRHVKHGNPVGQYTLS